MVFAIVGFPNLPFDFRDTDSFLAHLIALISTHGDLISYLSKLEFNKKIKETDAYSYKEIII